MSDLVIHDLAEQLPGELRGGEVNFVGRLQRTMMHAPTHTGHRFRTLVFGIDDNNVPGEFTSLGVITIQPRATLRGVMTEEGGLMTIAVHHIGDPEPALLYRGTEIFLRPVYGIIEHIPVNAAMAERNLRRIGHIPAPANACATFSYDAKRNPVHAHLCCLDDAGNRVSAEEKARRLVEFNATLGAKPNAKTNGGSSIGWSDGDRRTMAILRSLQRSAHLH